MESRLVCAQSHTYPKQARESLVLWKLIDGSFNPEELRGKPVFRWQGIANPTCRHGIGICFCD